MSPRVRTIVLAALLAAFQSPASAQLVINEVEANTPGDPDLQEFIELEATGPLVFLDDYVLVLYNGATDTVYNAFDLSGGVLFPGELYVVAGDPTTPNIDLDVSPDSHFVQNGPDAVALYFGRSASEFAPGTPLDLSGLVDAVVYGIDDPDDLGLLPLLHTGEPQLNEEAGGSSATESMQRCSGGSRETSGFVTALPTPGTANTCGPVCGDGVPEGDEDCDDGVANGTTASCCTASCGFQPVNTACTTGPSGGACDLSDRCNATGACVDRVRGAGYVCRAAPGACDVAEVCDGASKTCPTNTFASGGPACRPADGLCDVAEFCDGSGPDCPEDDFAAGGVCGPVRGPCDVAEVCDGAGPDCPTDRFASTGTCRDADGICDLAESCDGSGPACPEDRFLNGGPACRPADGLCDVAEFCDGSGTDCPADTFLDATAVCRDADGVCDVAETCSGTGAHCPADVFLGSDVECRSSGGACNPAEHCGGAGPDCPADTMLEDGADCDNGLLCDGSASCQSGVCTATAAPTCDDGDACTTDMCLEPDGCSTVRIEGCCAVAADCDDGNPCTIEACVADRCEHEAVPNCEFDAGPAPETDGGLTGSDGGGTLGSDGGLLTLDAGDGSVAGGCSCRATSGPTTPRTAWLLLIGLRLVAGRFRGRIFLAKLARQHR